MLLVYICSDLYYDHPRGLLALSHEDSELN